MKEFEEKVRESIKRRYLAGVQIEKPIHPGSSYAQTVRQLLESGEVGLEDIQRVFTDTTFLNSPED